MLTPYFLTSNTDKYEAVKRLIPDLERIDTDIDEIQSLDIQEVVAHKLAVASERYADRLLIVEDTALAVPALGGLPGPLVKWFLQALGTSGLVSLMRDGVEAYAQTMFGVRANDADHFFEGRVKGTLTLPRGEHGFGWDSIFVPSGYDKTFSEMTRSEKQQAGMRPKAVVKMAEFLSTLD